MYKTAKFKIFELYQLNSELAYFLGEKINIVTKFDMTELNNQIVDILKPVEEIKQDLKSKHPFKTPEDENYKVFEKEVREMLDQEREVKYIPLEKERLNFESENNYAAIYKLVDKKETVS